MENLFIKTSELPAYIADEYFYGKDIVSIYDLIATLEDLHYQYEKRTEEYKDLIDDVRDNYKFIGEREAIGYDESW